MGNSLSAVDSSASRVILLRRHFLVRRQRAHNGQWKCAGHERIEALTMNLELAHRNIQELTVLAQKDGENIRPLRAEIHKWRLRSSEGDAA
jgi:hypothetical protein